MAFTVSNIIYKSNGDLIGWGNNEYGQLGINNKPGTNVIDVPTLIMQDKDIIQIACGGYHTIIYKSNGDVIGFGRNDYNQLGIELSTIKYIPKLIINDTNIKKIYCGGYFTILYKYNGDFLYMGPIAVFNTYTTKPLLLFNDKEIKKIVCGGYNFIIYKNNGQVINYTHYSVHSSANIYTPFILTTDMNIKTIKCREHCTLLYKNNGELYEFNNSSASLLNTEPRLNNYVLVMHNLNIDKILPGGNHTIIKNNNNYLSFGKNNYGQLGLGHHGDAYTHIPTFLITCDDIIKIIPGYYHNIIYKNNGDLFGFGNNNYKQLGINKNCINKPTFLMNEPDIILINGKKINIKWNKQLFNKLNIKIKQQILTFMMVKHIYNKLYGIYIVPYMRDCIINLFINK